MKIALMNEFSQAQKNTIVLEQLELVASKYGHVVYNTGMIKEDDNPYLSYLHLGIQAFLLLNSKAVDFVITGCGTGQGANMTFNNFPGVVCGLVIDPTDAFLFSQINNGNSISIPFAKGFGWGAELNISYIFEKLFSCEKGMGYPPERKESQNRNSKLLFEVKKATGKGIIEILNSLDKDMLYTSISGQRFQDCFFGGCLDDTISDYVKSKI